MPILYLKLCDCQRILNNIPFFIGRQYFKLKWRPSWIHTLPWPYALLRYVRRRYQKDVSPLIIPLPTVCPHGPVRIVKIIVVAIVPCLLPLLYLHLHDRGRVHGHILVHLNFGRHQLILHGPGRDSRTRLEGITVIPCRVFFKWVVTRGGPVPLLLCQ